MTELLKLAIDRQINMDKSIPNAKVFIIILLVYSVILIPSIFLLLKAVNKRHYLRGSIITLSALCAVVIFIFSLQTRIEKPFYQHVRVFQNDLRNKETPIQSEKIYLSITSPSNRDFDLFINPKYTIDILPTVNSAKDHNKIYKDISAEIAVIDEGKMHKIKVGSAASFLPRYFALHTTTFTEPIKQLLVSDYKKHAKYDLTRFVKEEETKEEFSRKITANIKDERLGKRLISAVEYCLESEIVPYPDCAISMLVIIEEYDNQWQLETDYEDFGITLMILYE